MVVTSVIWILDGGIGLALALAHPLKLSWTLSAGTRNAGPPPREECCGSCSVYRDWTVSAHVVWCASTPHIIWHVQHSIPTGCYESLQGFLSMSNWLMHSVCLHYRLYSRSRILSSHPPRTREAALREAAAAGMAVQEHAAVEAVEQVH